MKKLEISIYKNRDYSKKCILCDRRVGEEYYDVNIEYEDDKIKSGRYRHFCNECYCQLNKHFTGVD